MRDETRSFNRSLGDGFSFIIWACVPPRTCRCIGLLVCSGQNGPGSFWERMPKHSERVEGGGATKCVVWKAFGAPASFWEVQGASGSLWELLGASRSPLGPSGSVWKLLRAPGSLWKPTRASGRCFLERKQTLGAPGSLRVALGCSWSVWGLFSRGKMRLWELLGALGSFRRLL